MRKLFSLIAAVLFAGSMMAAETVVFSEEGYTNGQAIESYEGTDFTITFDKGTNNNAPKYYTTGAAIRCYGGNTFTIASEKDIVKIELSFAEGEGTNAILTDVEAYADGVWAGKAKAIKFTIDGTTGHRRLASVAVTVEDQEEDPDEIVIYDWRGKIGSTILGASGATEATVKIHENTDEYPAIKLASSYVYADGKWISIKPAEGGFKAGDVLYVTAVISNDVTDGSKYAQVDVFAADGATNLFRGEPVVNGKKSADDPVTEKFVLESDQDSLFIGRYGNTNLFVLTLMVGREEGETPIEPLTKPEKAPAAPKQAVKDVIAIYCNHYTNNNADFQISGWAGGYETLDLQGTKAAFWTDMTWECIIDQANIESAHDFSAYENVHIDIWAPLPAKVKISAESYPAGYKDGNKVDLAQGWNSFDFALAEWPEGFDFSNMKCFTIDQYQTPEGESFEHNPFAIANVYFWNKATAEVDTLPCAIAAEDALAGQTYETKVLGYVTEIAYPWKADSKNLSFWMADTKDGGKVIEAYKCSVENEADVPAVGDLVVASGKLTKYNTTPELDAGCTVEIIERAPAYYVVGTMTGWEVKAEYQLAPKGLEYVGEFTFAKDDAFKVVKNQKETWYPDGMGNDYKITEAGDYTIRFNPEGGQEGWYEGYFLVEPKTVDTITCAKAAEDALAGETYEAFVKGYVTEIAYAWQNQSMSFWMADVKDGGKVFEAYKCAIEKEEDAVRVGDLVVAHGTLTKYNSTPELAAGCTVEILERAPEVVPQNLGEKTIAEFLELKNKIDTCILTGAIDSLVNTQYGNFNIVDATGKVYVYGLKDAEGNYCFEAAGLAEGDIITIKAIYSEFNSAPQVKNAIFVRKKGQGIDNTGVETKVEKFFRNGQLIIRKNGVEYNAQGARVL